MKERHIPVTDESDTAPIPQPDKKVENYGQVIAHSDLPDSIDLPETLDEHEQSNSSGSKKLRFLTIGLLSILVLAVLGAGGYFGYRYFQDQGTPEANQSVDEPQPTPQPSLPLHQQDVVKNIIYIHGDTTDAEGTLYSRPIGGADREVLATEPQRSTMRPGVHADHLGSGRSVLTYIVEDTQIWLTRPGQESEMIYELANTSESIDTAVASPDGTMIAFSAYELGGKGRLITISSSGEDEQTLHDTTEVSDRWSPLKWSGDGSQLFLRQTITHSEGPLIPPLKIFTIDTGEFTDVIPAGPSAIGKFSINDAFTKLIFVEMTVDESIAVPGLFGYYIGSPYSIQVATVGDSSVKTIASIGQKEEKDDFGEYTYRNIHVGWQYTDTGQDIYYTDDNKVMAVDPDSDNEPYSLFEALADQTIGAVWFASTKTVVAGTDLPEGGYTITSFDVPDSSAEIIMETTDLTELVGFFNQ